MAKEPTGTEDLFEVDLGLDDQPDLFSPGGVGEDPLFNPALNPIAPTDLFTDEPFQADDLFTPSDIEAPPPTSRPVEDSPRNVLGSLAAPTVLDATRLNFDLLDGKRLQMRLDPDATQTLTEHTKAMSNGDAVSVATKPVEVPLDEVVYLSRVEIPDQRTYPGGGTLHIDPSSGRSFITEETRSDLRKITAEDVIASVGQVEEVFGDAPARFGTTLRTLDQPVALDDLSLIGEQIDEAIGIEQPVQVPEGMESLQTVQGPARTPALGLGVAAAVRPLSAPEPVKDFGRYPRFVIGPGVAIANSPASTRRILAGIPAFVADISRGTAGTLESFFRPFQLMTEGVGAEIGHWLGGPSPEELDKIFGFEDAERYMSSLPINIGATETQAGGAILQTGGRQASHGIGRVFREVVEGVATSFGFSGYSLLAERINTDLPLALMDWEFLLTPSIKGGLAFARGFSLSPSLVLSEAGKVGRMVQPYRRSKTPFFQGVGRLERAIEWAGAASRFGLPVSAKTAGRLASEFPVAMGRRARRAIANIAATGYEFLTPEMAKMVDVAQLPYVRRILDPHERATRLAFKDTLLEAIEAPDAFPELARPLPSEGAAVVAATRDASLTHGHPASGLILPSSSTAKWWTVEGMRDVNRERRLLVDAAEETRKVHDRLNSTKAQLGSHNFRTETGVGYIPTKVSEMDTVISDLGRSERILDEYTVLRQDTAVPIETLDSKQYSRVTRRIQRLRRKAREGKISVKERGELKALNQQRGELVRNTREFMKQIGARSLVRAIDALESAPKPLTELQSSELTILHRLKEDVIRQDPQLTTTRLRALAEADMTDRVASLVEEVWPADISSQSSIADNFVFAKIDGVSYPLPNGFKEALNDTERVVLGSLRARRRDIEAVSRDLIKKEIASVSMSGNKGALRDAAEMYMERRLPSMRRTEALEAELNRIRSVRESLDSKKQLPGLLSDDTGIPREVRVNLNARELEVRGRLADEKYLPFRMRKEIADRALALFELQKRELSNGKKFDASAVIQDIPADATPAQAFKIRSKNQKSIAKERAAVVEQHRKLVNNPFDFLTEQEAAFLARSYINEMRMMADMPSDFAFALERMAYRSPELMQDWPSIRMLAPVEDSAKAWANINAGMRRHAGTPTLGLPAAVRIPLEQAHVIANGVRVRWRAKSSSHIGDFGPSALPQALIKRDKSKLSKSAAEAQHLSDEMATLYPEYFTAQGKTPFVGNISFGEAVTKAAEHGMIDLNTVRLKMLLHVPRTSPAFDMLWSAAPDKVKLGYRGMRELYDEIYKEVVASQARAGIKESDRMPYREGYSPVHVNDVIQEDAGLLKKLDDLLESKKTEIESPLSDDMMHWLNEFSTKPETKAGIPDEVLAGFLNPRNLEARLLGGINLHDSVEAYINAASRLVAWNDTLPILKKQRARLKKAGMGEQVRLLDDLVRHELGYSSTPEWVNRFGGALRRGLESLAEKVTEPTLERAGKLAGERTEFQGGKLGVRFIPFSRKKSAMRLAGTVNKWKARTYLGLAVDSAIRNLGDQVRVASRLGVRPWMRGFRKHPDSLGGAGIGFDAWKREFIKSDQIPKLVESGVMEQYHLFASAFDEIPRVFDTVVMAPFQLSEYTNRGVSFNSAFLEALIKGFTPDQAMSAAAEFVNYTNFKYGSPYVSVWFNNPLVSGFTSFVKFPLKFGEFALDAAVNSVRSVEDIATRRWSYYQRGFNGTTRQFADTYKATRFLAMIGFLTTAADPELAWDYFLGAGSESSMHPLLFGLVGAMSTRPTGMNKRGLSRVGVQNPFARATVRGGAGAAAGTGVSQGLDRLQETEFSPAGAAVGAAAALPLGGIAVLGGAALGAVAGGAVAGGPIGFERVGDKSRPDVGGLEAVIQFAPNATTDPRDGEVGIRDADTLTEPRPDYVRDGSGRLVKPHKVDPGLLFDPERSKLELEHAQLSPLWEGLSFDRMPPDLRLAFSKYALGVDMASWLSGIVPPGADNAFAKGEYFDFLAETFTGPMADWLMTFNRAGFLDSKGSREFNRLAETSLAGVTIRGTQRLRSILPKAQPVPDQVPTGSSERILTADGGLVQPLVGELGGYGIADLYDDFVRMPNLVSRNPLERTMARISASIPQFAAGLPARGPSKLAGAIADMYDGSDKFRLKSGPVIAFGNLTKTQQILRIAGFNPSVMNRVLNKENLKRKMRERQMAVQTYLRDRLAHEVSFGFVNDAHKTRDTIAMFVGEGMLPPTFLASVEESAMKKANIPLGMVALLSGNVSNFTLMKQAERGLIGFDANFAPLDIIADLNNILGGGVINSDVLTEGAIGVTEQQRVLGGGVGDSGSSGVTDKPKARRSHIRLRRALGTK